MDIRKWYNWIFCRRVALENEELRARLAAVVEYIESAPVDSGVCCCGEEMIGHDNSHIPVDMWHHAVRSMTEEVQSSLQGDHFYTIKVLGDPNYNIWKKVVLERLISMGIYSPSRHDISPIHCVDDIVGKSHGTIRGCVGLRSQADCLANFLGKAIRKLERQYIMRPDEKDGDNDEFVKRAGKALDGYTKFCKEKSG